MAFQTLMMSSHQLLEHSVTGVDYTVFHGSWIPSSPRLVVCGSSLAGEGVIRVYSLSGEVRERGRDHQV